MTAINSFEWNNLKRDFSEVLSTLVSNTPGFINLFPLKGKSTQTKHEWLEDQIKPKQIAYSAYDADSVPGTFTVSNSAGWELNDYVKIFGNPAIFKIISTSSTSIAVSLVASNGGFTALSGSGSPSADAGILCFVSRPMNEGSSAGIDVHRQSSTEFNYSQILRRDITLTATSTAVQTLGMENALPYQEEEAMRQIVYEINLISLFGVRQQRTASTLGTAGGLYYYGTQTGGLCDDYSVSPVPLSTNIINKAAQKIVEAGGTPSVILCGTGQARMISRLYTNTLNIQRADQVRGSYVSQIVNESTGGLMQVFAEPNMIDSDIWVIDPSGFGLVWLRDLVSSDSTSPNQDGFSRKLIGEFSLEFKNAKQKLCRVQGLQPSAAALNT
ncbi:MAG: DUF5309 family protein [Planctomycetia bacterium]|nr:DUF5309 family protein [Planctomycetia bacterium]